MHHQIPTSIHGFLRHQMDMMGYYKEAPRTYEIHAGSDRQWVQDSALILAERIGELSKQVSPNLADDPQIYLNIGLAWEDKDPAYFRSDHYNFNLLEYPACLASEDLFAGPHPASPQKDANPNYHTVSDTSVDHEYAAAAAWATANLKGVRDKYERRWEERNFTSSETRRERRSTTGN